MPHHENKKPKANDDMEFPQPKFAQKLKPELSSQPSLQAILEQADAWPCIRFTLPPADALSGVVLRHAVRTIETLFSKHAPMIFKVGFTHNPVWRWENKLYGYSWSRDKWSNMEVLYVSGEPFAPAMLEAALIEKYQSVSSVFACFILGFGVFASARHEPQRATVKAAVFS